MLIYSVSPAHSTLQQLHLLGFTGTKKYDNVVIYPRFLHLLATFDFQNAPIVVDFDNELKKEDVEAIQVVVTINM